MADVQVAIEWHLYLTFFGRLGGYHNDTITTLRTVDGGQRGILQNVDAGDVRWRNIVDVIYLKTIDNKQWVVFLRDRRAATYTDVNICTRLTVDSRYLNTGNFTL